MKKRDDQVTFLTQHADDCGCCAFAFNSIGVMPPTEVFEPGEMVHYYDRPDCIGLIVSRAPREVEYAGLSTWKVTKEGLREGREKAIIDFYTVLWSNGSLKTAGAHMLHQLRRVDGQSQAAQPG